MDRANRAAQIRSVSRLRVRRRRRFASLALALALLTLAGTAALVIAARSPRFLVSRVSVSGNSGVPSADILAAVASTTQGAFLGIVPRDSSFFYPERDIAAAVASVSPRILGASVEVSGGAAVVSVTERVPFALWCAAPPPGDASCYLMDENGYIFAPAPTYQGSAFVRFAGGLSGASGRAPLSGRFLDRERLNEILFLVNELRGFGVDTAALSLDDIGTVTVLTRSNATIRIGRRDHFAAALRNLDSLLADPSIPVRAALLKGDLDTLDLRLDGKLFFSERSASTTTR